MCCQCFSTPSFQTWSEKCLEIHTVTNKLCHRSCVVVQLHILFQGLLPKLFLVNRISLGWDLHLCALDTYLGDVPTSYVPQSTASDDSHDLKFIFVPSAKFACIQHHHIFTNSSFILSRDVEFWCVPGSSVLLAFVMFACCCRCSCFSQWACSSISRNICTPQDKDESDFTNLQYLIKLFPPY